VESAPTASRHVTYVQYLLLGPHGPLAKFHHVKNMVMDTGCREAIITLLPFANCVEIVEIGIVFWSVR
jgi:hypothetical protein